MRQAGTEAVLVRRATKVGEMFALVDVAIKLRRSVLRSSHKVGLMDGIVR